MCPNSNHLKQKWGSVNLGHIVRFQVEYYFLLNSTKSCRTKIICDLSVFGFSAKGINSLDYTIT